MARAQGARAQMALAFETTYGTPPVSGYTKMPFASTTLGAAQPLQTSELLGYPRTLTTEIARPAARDESSARRAIAQPAPTGVNTNRAPVAAG